jgi:hypothetical protein
MRSPVTFDEAKFVVAGELRGELTPRAAPPTLVQIYGLAFPDEVGRAGHIALQATSSCVARAIADR